MKKTPILKVAGMLVFLLFSGVAWAQVTTGTISGTLKDSSGAPLPGVQVVVENEGTGITRTVTTDDTGHYSALALSLGSYKVTYTHEGFTTEVRTGIVLTVGREAVVDLTLTVGAETQKVVVTGEAPLVETTTASLGSLVDDRAIRALPLNGRSYDQLALLQPGVVIMSPGVTSGTPFSGGTGRRFSVGGQRENSNNFLLDGTNISDFTNGTPGGAAGLNLGVDTILEFKIFTNSFKAEYGHSSGSIVSSVTRSGANAVHGTAFEYLRNSALDDRNYFDVGSSPPPFRRNQFGGVLGGPIKRDKAFFFGGYEGLRQALATTLTAIVPDAKARQGILPCTGTTPPCVNGTETVPVNPVMAPYINLYPLPNGRDFGDGTADYISAPTVPTNEDYGMGRLDYQLNQKTGIFGRYSYDADKVYAEQSLPNIYLIDTSRRQYTTVQANSILSNRALNNVRLAYNRTASATDTRYVPDPGPQLDIIPGEAFGSLLIGASPGGLNTITPTSTSAGGGAYTWAFNIFEGGDDFTYVKGKHSLKIGTDIQRMQDNTVNGLYTRGAYTFKTFTTFLAGTPSQLKASSPLGVNHYDGLRQSEFAVYAQDDYIINPRVTVNLGLRWEAVTDPRDANRQNAYLPSPAATANVISGSFFTVAKKNFEPRIGVAWQVNRSGKTVVRAGGGIYHNQVLPWAYSSQVIVPPFFYTFTATNPPFPGGASVLKLGAAPISLSQFAPSVKTPVVDQYNLSIQQQIFSNTMLQVAFAGSHSNHLPLQAEADTTTPTFCTSTPNPCPSGMLPNQPPIYYSVTAARVNPAFAGIRWYQMNGTDEYNSGTVTLRRQFSSGFQGQIFYTYSKSLDDGSVTQGFESVRSPAAVMDPYDFHRDWGLSDFDVKSVLGANFSYSIPSPVRSNDVSGKVLGAIVNGWTLDGIATLESGQPFTPRLAAAVSRDGAVQLAERPNLNTGFSNNPSNGSSAGCSGFAAGTKLHNAINWYDPCAYSLPLAGTYGNLGRNTVIGPGLADYDGALEKSFKLKEKVDATFRFEMFNILNHANFGLPNTLPLSTTGAVNGSTGVITYTTTSSRQLQFALRISF